MRHRPWCLALVGASILLMSLALAACGSATSARSVLPGFTGYVWQVVAISHDGKVTSIPARLQVALRFSPGGQFGANDSTAGRTAQPAMASRPALCPARWSATPGTT